MTATALVLAAHGSRHEPAVNAQVRTWAAQAMQRTAFDEIAVAFHQGSPAFSEVLDTLTAKQVTVVPIMTSAGYYSDTVLPRELARNRRFPHLAIRQTGPVGLHRDIPRMIAERVDMLSRTHSFPACRKSELSLVIVGHGTPRHPASRDATISLVRKLSKLQEFGEVVATFLDDVPPVEELLKLTTRTFVVVVPFLIAAGPHATTDIPRRIGLPPFDVNSKWQAHSSHGRTVLCDIPFGQYPGMIELIIDLASPYECCDSSATRPVPIEVT